MWKKNFFLSKKMWKKKLFRLHSWASWWGRGGWGLSGAGRGLLIVNSVSKHQHFPLRRSSTKYFFLQSIQNNSLPKISFWVLHRPEISIFSNPLGGFSLTASMLFKWKITRSFTVLAVFFFNSFYAIIKTSANTETIFKQKIFTLLCWVFSQIQIIQRIIDFSFL